MLAWLSEYGLWSCAKCGVFMAVVISDLAANVLQKSAYRLIGSKEDFDPLMELIGAARYVLLGEASHGTHEFYQARAELTKRLILEKGFTVVAWEADWPDALRVNRYVREGRNDRTAEEALRGFQRFPT